MDISRFVYDQERSGLDPINALILCARYWPSSSFVHDKSVMATRSSDALVCPVGMRNPKVDGQRVSTLESRRRNTDH